MERSQVAEAAGRRGFRVAVLVPSRGRCVIEFALHLAELFRYTALRRPEISLRLFSRSHTLLSNNRLQLARDALAAEADWVFWIDDDVLVPPDALNVLLLHGLDIVGAATTFKNGSRALAAETVTTAQPYVCDSGDLIELELIGFGCLLMRAPVLHDLLPDCFGVRYLEVAQLYEHEDTAFCIAARRRGYRLFMDSRLTRQLGHVGRAVYCRERVTHLLDQPYGLPRAEDIA